MQDKVGGPLDHLLSLPCPSNIACRFFLATREEIPKSWLHTISVRLSRTSGEQYKPRYKSKNMSAMNIPWSGFCYLSFAIFTRWKSSLTGGHAYGRTNRLVNFLCNKGLAEVARLRFLLASQCEKSFPGVDQCTAFVCRNSKNPWWKDSCIARGV